MMREKNWWKEHRTGIRNALIGAAVIGVAVGGWGTYSMYRNRRMTELMIEARNQERVQQRRETAGTEYRRDPHRAGPEGRADGRSARSEPDAGSG